MVDALREARRVLVPRGVLPVPSPMAVEVVAATRTIWAKEVTSYKTPEDLAAAEAAVQQALLGEWFVFEKSLLFDFEIYCHTAADLSLYVQTRKLPDAEIPYKELEERRCALNADGQTARLRCRRPWLLSAYRKE